VGVRRVGGGGAARPQPALEVGLALGGDLVGALDRVQRAHVERDGEQFDVHRGLGDGVKRRRVERLEFGITRGAGADADGPWHGRSSTGCDRDFGFYASEATPERHRLRCITRPVPWRSADVAAQLIADFASAQSEIAIKYKTPDSAPRLPRRWRGLAKRTAKM